MTGGGGVKIITKEKGYISAHLYLHSSYSRSDPETIAPEVLRPASLFRLHPRDTLLIPSPYHPIRSQDTPPSQDTRDIQDTRPICPQQQDKDTRTSILSIPVLQDNLMDIIQYHRTGITTSWVNLEYAADPAVVGLSIKQLMELRVRTAAASVLSVSAERFTAVGREQEPHQPSSNHQHHKSNKYKARK